MNGEARDSGMEGTRTSPPGFGFSWVPVGSGRLALWHRPGLRAIPYLSRTGCDRVVTLLSAAEGAEEVGAAVETAGLAWSWIPLASGRPPQGGPDRVARAGVRGLLEWLEAGESILLHCSAGIHRTGMIAYAALRSSGCGRAASLRRIAEMRSHTRNGLREAHLIWGEEVAKELASDE